MTLKDIIGKHIIVFTDEETITDYILSSTNYDGIILSQEQENQILYKFIPMPRINKVTWYIEKPSKNPKNPQEENENGEQT